MVVSKEWIHLRSFLRQAYNAEVRNYFKTQDTSNLPQNDTGKNSAMRACLITPTDSLLLINTKVMTFRFTVQRVHLRPNVYALPNADIDALTFAPQVKLYFSQDDGAVPEGKTKIDAEISFRLTGESETTYTPAKAQLLATEIKNHFGGSTGFKWNKGKVICVYEDKQHGYHLRIYAQNYEEGERVIRQVLAIRSHSFNGEHFSYSTPQRQSANNPTERRMVYGKQRLKPRWRPTASVRFRYARLYLQGLEPVILYDRTGWFREALQKP